MTPDEQAELERIRERDAAWGVAGRVTNASRASHDRRALLRHLAHVGREPLAPFVHLNGTSRESLLEQLREVKLAVEAARDALQAAAPHGRDYYVISDDAYRQAIREHNSRYDRLTSVLEELTEIYIDVHRAGKG